MPRRKEEAFSTERFQIGTGYSRPEIASLAGVERLVSPREWTGIVEFANCIVLFSTLDKSDLPPEHQYADLFIGPQFKWESQNINTQNTPVIQKLRSGHYPVLLFARKNAKGRDRKASRFIYAGQLAPVRFQSERPVKGLFDLLDYRPGTDASLDALYSWRPKDIHTRKLEPVEEPEAGEVRYSRKGQGRQMDGVKKDLVEDRAMDVCFKVYTTKGYNLTNTSKTQPFDYIARKQNTVRRVEVKGTTGDLGKVTITAGELLAVRKDRVPTDLFVLYNIQLVEFSPGKFRAEGGEIYWDLDWAPKDNQLRPTQYEYTISP